jgi:phage major head subunit gpT-like protein
MGSLKAYNYTVADQTWANGLRVKRKHIEDDKLGLYTPAMRQMAQNFDLAKSKLLFTTKMANGFSGAQGTGYDGQFFFDTDHLDNEETAQSNKTTAALSVAAYEAGTQAMLKYTDDKGEYLNIMATHLVVPPQLKQTAQRIVGRKLTLEAGATSDVGVENINAGDVAIIIAPWLAGSATHWFLADLSKELKPFIFQPRVPVEFVMKDKPDDDNVFGQDEVHAGGRERYTIAFGAWQTMYGSTGV